MYSILPEVLLLPHYKLNHCLHTTFFPQENRWVATNNVYESRDRIFILYSEIVVANYFC